MDSIISTLVAASILGTVVTAGYGSLSRVSVYERNLKRDDLEISLQNLLFENTDPGKSTVVCSATASTFTASDGQVLLPAGEKTFFAGSYNEVKLAPYCENIDSENRLSLNQKYASSDTGDLDYKPTFGDFSFNYAGCTESAITFEKKGDGSPMDATKTTGYSIAKDEYKSFGILFDWDDSEKPRRGVVFYGANAGLNQKVTDSSLAGGYQCNTHGSYKGYIKGRNAKDFGNFYLSFGAPDNQVTFTVTYIGEGTDEASGFIRDFDSSERWIITPYNKNGEQIKAATDIKAPPKFTPNTDCSYHAWKISKLTCAQIASKGLIKQIKFVGRKPNAVGFGIGFDNFTPQRCGVSVQDRIANECK